MAFTPGSTVGPYRIIEQLGQGGMATVYKAYHAALDRYVAVKVLHPAFKADPNFLERFRREARIVANMHHPHIVPVYDFAEHEGAPYLVMRYIEGKTLKSLLTGTPMSLEETLRIFRPVAEALAYAHQHGILHRDVKPSNIILSEEGEVFLTDFGLARIAHAGDSTLSRDAMIGTPQYISPEQARGETDSLDARTDIYSLGVVLYEMLTGRTPFQADTPYAVIHDHIFTPLPLPTSINPNIPPDVERILLKALAKDPEDRYPDVLTFLHAFEHAVELHRGEEEAAQAAVEVPAIPPQVQEQAPEKGVEEKAERSKKGVWIALGIVGVLLVLALLGLGGLFLVRRARLARETPTAVAVSTPTPGPVVEETPVEPREVPSEAQMHLEQAKELARQGDLEGALEELDAAIALAPEWAEPYLWQGEIYAQQERYAEALAAYRKAIEYAPQKGPLLSRAGVVAMVADRWIMAELFFSQALEEDPESPDAHAGMALVYLHKENVGQAQAELLKAEATDPDMPLVVFAEGAFAEVNGDLEEALASYEVVANDQETPFILRREAQRRMRVLGGGSPKGDQPSGGSEDAAAHLDRAETLYGQGDLDQAIGELKQAVEADPEWAVPHLRLGDMMAELGDVEAAEQEYRQALALAEDDVRLMATVGWNAMAIGANDLAVEAFSKGMATSPADPEIALGMAATALLVDAGISEQQLEDVRLLLLSLTQLAPDLPQTNLVWGLYYGAVGDAERARQRFQQIIDDPGVPMLIREMARRRLEMMSGGGGTEGPPPGGQGAVLFKDDFEEDLGRWITFSEENGYALYRGGRLELGVYVPQYAVWSLLLDHSFTDFALEVDATLEEGPPESSYGVIFRFQDENHFYAFVLRGDGSIVMGKVEDGEWIQLLDWGASTLAYPGVRKTNHLRLECVGDTFYLFVNGQAVTDVYDDRYASGAIGVVAMMDRGDRMIVSFDRLIITEIQ